MRLIAQANVVFSFCFLILLTPFINVRAQDAEEDSLQIYLHNADSLKRKGDVKLALKNYNHVISIVKEQKNKKLLLSVYDDIGDLYRFQGKPNMAIQFYHKSKNLSLQIKDSTNYIKNLTNLGNSYANTVLNDSAFYYYNKTLQLIDSVNNRKWYASLLYSIARSYSYQKDWDYALKFLHKSSDILSQIKDSKNLFVITNGIGVVYLEKGDFENALIQHKKVLKMMQEHDAILKGYGYEFVTYHNLGNDYKGLTNYDSAYYYLKKAKYIAETSKNNAGLSQVYYSLSDLNIKQKKYTQAIDHLTTGTKILDQHPNLMTSIEYSTNFYKAYQGLGKYKKSLAYHEKLKSLTDSAAKAASLKKMEEFKVQYETALKQNQIEILHKENELKSFKIVQSKKQYQQRLLFISIFVVCAIAGVLLYHFLNKRKLIAVQENLRFKAVIEAEEQERKRIAQDLHDDLGQSIASITALVSNINPKNEKEEKKLLKLQKIANNTYDNLRNISHNIMPKTLIDSGIINAIHELIDQIQEANQITITFSNQGDFDRLNHTQTISLYRITQEALTNIIKHSQATKADIALSYPKTGDLRLSIQDNGIGLNTSIIKQGGGIGWQNILSRASLIRGKVDLISEPGKGANLLINIATEY